MPHRSNNLQQQQPALKLLPSQVLPIKFHPAEVGSSGSSTRDNTAVSTENAHPDADRGNTSASHPKQKYAFHICIHALYLETLYTGSIRMTVKTSDAPVFNLPYTYINIIYRYEHAHIEYGEVDFLTLKKTANQTEAQES